MAPQSDRAAPTIDEEAAAEAAQASTLSARSNAPPSIGGSRTSRRDNVSAIHAGASRDGAPAQSDSDRITLDKASQPDPIQAPLPPTGARSSTASSAPPKAPLKESASQADNTQQTSEPAALSANAKGKAREIVDSSSTPVDRAASSENDAQDKAERAAARRRTAADRLQKRRLKRKERASGKPSRPLSAYLLYVNSVRADRQSQNPQLSLTRLTSAIAAEWRELQPELRGRWETEAASLRQRYDAELEAWKQAHPEGVQLGPEDESDMETTSELDDNGVPIRRKKRRVTAARQPHTVSDDEEEYRKQLYQEGPQLAASRIDPSDVMMADISTADYKKGRAGPRTFEAERVYNRLVTERRAAARSALLGGHVLGDKLDAASPSPAPPSRVLRATNGAPVDATEEVLEGEEEEVVGDRTEEDEDEDADSDDDSDDAASARARRKREASVAATDVSFRENRFAVQTRIVDGKIVLDETSLFANFGNEEDRDNMEVVDEREGDRFVNAATYSRKLGRNRKWTADETAKFYRALQQWGTDFEMIARLFPGRDRVMVKKKFNVEERSNGKLVDEALRNSIPVNLEAYAAAIGVDLSGPPPEIKADIQDIASLAVPEGVIKKREGTAPISGRKGGRSDAEDDADDDDGYEYEEVVEVDDDGNEQVIRRRLGKKPGSRGAGRKRRNSARKNSVSTPAPPAVSAGGTGAGAGAGAGAEADGDTDAAAGGAAGAGRSGGPPSIGSRKSTRSTRPRAASTREAPGDGNEVEQIVGEA